jgi:hypothetical protein
MALSNVRTRIASAEGLVLKSMTSARRSAQLTLQPDVPLGLGGQHPLSLCRKGLQLRCWGLTPAQSHRSYLDLR